MFFAFIFELKYFFVSRQIDKSYFILKNENKTGHIFIGFRNSSLESKNTKRSLIYGTTSYKNIHCGSLRERGATCWLYLSAGGAGVLSSLLSLRRWVEVLPDSNSLNCKCIILQCG